jgi:hypothetical protein
MILETVWNIGKIMMYNYSTISVLNMISYILISLGKIYEIKIGIYSALFLLIISLYLYVIVSLKKREKPKNRISLYIQPIFISFLIIYSFHILGYY